jgi:Flp pilus assembly protein TadD
VDRSALTRSAIAKETAVTRSLSIGWLVVWAGLGLVGCAVTPPAPPPAVVFADERFAPPTQALAAADVFALSDAMRSYISHGLARQTRAKGLRDGFLDALYDQRQLKLRYDSTLTRTAAQTFDERAGNCLSLVIMTAAFAKALDLPVRYQAVISDESWSRVADLFFLSGHVNLSLSPPRSVGGAGAQSLTVDFLPAVETRGLQTREIDENTVVAMYFNNRAAEALTEGRLDDAYWRAREAIVQSPTFYAAYNTLGVVYQRHGDLALAENMFSAVRQRDPANISVASNLAGVWDSQGRSDEARALRASLNRSHPLPPLVAAFAAFDLGRAAYQRGDLMQARQYFVDALRSDAEQAEFHFWLAVTAAGLGDLAQARAQMALAVDNANRSSDRDRYAAKLERLRSVAAH